MTRSDSSNQQLRVAFGPEFPSAGSWEWIGEDLSRALASDFEVTFFGKDIPSCDIAVVVKFGLPANALRDASRRSALVYCPIDRYGSCPEIDADFESLRCYHRVLLHCRELRAYFQSYAPVEQVDHHVKHVASPPTTPREDGPLLWTGVHSNLPPLVDWINTHPLSGELVILTNIEGTEPITPSQIGLSPSAPVTIETWTPSRHLEWVSRARAALDIKGNDFRQRHKPLTKALDFIASGLPFATVPGSGTERQLHQLGFEVASIGNPDQWFSRQYWEATQRFGEQIRKQYSLANVAQRFRGILRTVQQEWCRG